MLISMKVLLEQTNAIQFLLVMRKLLLIRNAAWDPVGFLSYFLQAPQACGYLDLR